MSHMELGKQGSSETSSSEEHEPRDDHRHHQQQAVVKEGTITTSNPSATTKRFYECSYCKKGFDNAQALGGHMNIHRGAKAKAKQGTSSTSNSSIAMKKSTEEYSNPSYGNMAPRGGFYPSLEARSNYHVHMYSQPSRSIPGHAEFVIPKPASSTSNEELLGSNLSLQIGSAGGEENRIDTEKVGEEDEVDLELRLGHHDRY